MINLIDPFFWGLIIAYIILHAAKNNKKSLKSFQPKVAPEVETSLPAMNPKTIPRRNK